MVRAALRATASRPPSSVGTVSQAGIATGAECRIDRRGELLIALAVPGNRMHGDACLFGGSAVRTATGQRLDEEGATVAQSTFGPRDRVVSALCALRHSSHRQLNLQRLVVPCSERAPRGEPPREMPLACAICRSLQGPVAGSFPALIQPPTVIVATPAISATSRLVRATMRGSSCSGTGVGGRVVGARATGADRLGGADGGHGRPHVGQPALPVASVAECPVSAM